MKSLTVTLTLKLAHKSFGMTLCLMMMHHHTKFDHERLSGSGDIASTWSGHMDRGTDGHSDSNITPSPLNEVCVCVGEYI